MFSCKQTVRVDKDDQSKCVKSRFGRLNLKSSKPNANAHNKRKRYVIEKKSELFAASTHRTRAFIRLYRKYEFFQHVVTKAERGWHFWMPSQSTEALWYNTSGGSTHPPGWTRSGRSGAQFGRSTGTCRPAWDGETPNQPRNALAPRDTCSDLCEETWVDTLPEKDGQSCSCHW